MRAVTLSKSSFGAGLQCHKRLWIEKKQPELVPETVPSQQGIFDQGHDVGVWSHKLFPGGILLSGELDFQAHLQASSEALAARKPLFEPAFAIPGAYARADILVPVDVASWDLLEVKSASNIWESNGQIKAVNLQDIAFQLYVYRQAGLDIRHAYLVFLNRDYVRNGDVDPHRLFRREDVTAQVEALLPTIPGQLVLLSNMLEGEAMPEVAIGPQCHCPYDCGLVGHCWKHVPEDSVLSLVRGGARSWRWWNGGIVRLIDLPSTETFSAAQAIQVEAERSKEPYFDAIIIGQFLGGFRYPLYFLDFETVMPAVPMFEGCRPYAQVPFQFSLHIQAAPGVELTHYEYLADGRSDPRPGFLDALQAHIGTQGSIVSYNSSFETSRLRELATQFPAHAAWINQTLVRFENADLLQPFRSFALYHPSQHGSASIKAVLPAFTNLGYEDLGIQEGGTASNEFLRLLKGLIASTEIPTLRQNLLNYCERDTWAMVKLFEKLHTLV